MEITCARRKRRIGISRIVLLKIIFLAMIILETQKNPIRMAIIKVTHILLNSKSSEVFPAKTKGTRRKSE